MKTLMVLTAAAVALGTVPALAQTYDPYTRTHSYRTQWPPGLEQHERSVTRQLNNEQVGQATQYYYPPQYSYVPPPQYSHGPQPTYAYPYDYPPRPWRPRY